MLNRTHHVWIAVLALMLAACGPKNNDPNNVVVEPDMGADAADAADDGPSDAANNEDPDLPDAAPDAAPDMPEDMTMLPECNGVTCDPGEECIDNLCVLTSSCGSALDLGELPLNMMQTVAGSLVTEGVEDLVNTCETPSLRDRVITFELTAQAVVEISFDRLGGQYDVALELRTDCEDAGTVVDCQDGDILETLDPGRYYLVIDQKLGNAGDFEVTISTTEALCTPGTRVCNADALTLCPMPDAPQTEVCAGGCTNASCHGDLCSNAIAVTGATTSTGGGPAYVPGDMNFGANVDCADAGDPTNPIDTPGYEVIFYLPGLTAGEVVTIDAETNDTNINAIFIKPACGDTGVCAAAYKLTEQPDWVVTANGNYYVIIDKRSPTNNDFQYSIDIL